MIVMTTMHNNGFEQLAKHTWEDNKVQYAQRHGYAVCAKTDNFYGWPPGFEKIQFLIDFLEENPQTTWIWWTGTDSMVMNFQTRIEDKLAQVRPDAHVVMSGDFNYHINCDSMLLRNSPESLAWLQDIMEHMPEYVQRPDKEQQYMLDSYEQHAAIMDLQPQSFMNSYEYSLYANDYWKGYSALDVKGNRGQWKSGDWLVHWPATGLAHRIELAKQYKEHIVY